MQLEIQLHKTIKTLLQEIKDMCPEDGLSSPRDTLLAKLINKKIAVLDHLQDAMRVYNSDYEIRHYKEES